MSADPTYEEMMNFIISTRPPIGITEDIAEGIYWFASERADTNHPNLYEAAAKCGFRPENQRVAVLSSESLARIVYDYLVEEYDRLPDKVLDSILAGVPSDAPEDKDLYDKEP